MKPKTMTNADVEVMFRETFEELIALRSIKSREYSDDGDALANFRRNAVDLEMPMETVWRVYASKHWDSIGNFIRDITNGKKRELSEPIEGRIHDMIVYLLLLKAMIKEKEDGGRGAEAPLQGAPP